MVRFVPFVTLLLLAAVSGETPSDPSEFEGQEDPGLAIEEQEGRELAYEDWAGAGGPRYWSEDPVYDGERLGNGRYYGTGQMAGARGNIPVQRLYERPAGQRASINDSRGQRYSNYGPMPERAGYRTGNVRGSNERFFDELGRGAYCTGISALIPLSCSATAASCFLDCIIALECSDNCKLADEDLGCTDTIDEFKLYCL